MSTTFTAEMSAITGYAVTCGCDDVEAPTFDIYQDALDYLSPLVEDESLRTALPGCDHPELCLAYRLQIDILEGDPAPSINVSNLNAGDLFRALGILADEAVELDDDLFPQAPLQDSPFNGGSMAPEDFLGRVLMALAITPDDEGRPGIESTRPGRATAVLCGRRPGYLQWRLAELHELAQFAVDRNRAVSWS